MAPAKYPASLSLGSNKKPRTLSARLRKRVFRLRSEKAVGPFEYEKPIFQSDIPSLNLLLSCTLEAARRNPGGLL